MPSELRRERDQARTERKREALLDAAGRSFERHGYHRTLVSDIASEAGVGQGTFYRHFPDKRAIFEALLDRLLARVFAGFAGMSANPPHDARSYRDASVAAIRRMAEVLDRERSLVTVLLREAPSIDRALQDKVAAVHETLADIAKGFLDRAVEEGFARPCRTAIVSRAIVGIGTSIASDWWSGRIRDASIDTLVEELVDFAFLGIHRD